MAKPCIEIINVSKETLSNHVGHTASTINWSTSQSGIYTVELDGSGYLTGDIIASGTLLVSGTVNTQIENTDIVSGENRINIYVNNDGNITEYNQILCGEKGYFYGGTSTQQECNCFDGNTWISKANLPSPARHLAAASTIGFNGYVYGGNSTNILWDCDCFDGTNWTSKNNLPTAARRELAASTISSNGYIYGGEAEFYGHYIRDCDCFDSVNWTNKTDIPNPGRNKLSASTIGSNGYIYGGTDGPNYLQDCDCFDGSSWTSKNSMPGPGRCWVAASTIGSNGYVYGGYWYEPGAPEGTSHDIRDCDCFDGSSWTSKADMPTPSRAYVTAVTLDSKAYIAGGLALTLGAIADVECFDGTNWISKDDLITATKNQAASAI